MATNQPFKRASDFIKTQLSEGVKEHVTYDGSARITHHYTAPLSAGNGDPCLLTRYQYDGVTTRITDLVEEIGTWDGSWDF